MHLTWSHERRQMPALQLRSKCHEDDRTADAWLEPEAIGTFSEEARRAVYECIALRRDIRHFRPGVALDDSTLTRILQAAQQAPSAPCRICRPTGAGCTLRASATQLVRPQCHGNTRQR